MSLKTWFEAGWLRAHKASPKEIRDLWLLADRDLRDAASGGISYDWQYNIAYNAALQLCTLVLYAEGYEPAKGQLAHYRVLQALPLILPKRKEDAEYLDACRTKRNKVEYDYAGSTTKEDALELVKFSEELRTEIVEWLTANHPELTKLIPS